MYCKIIEFSFILSSLALLFLMILREFGLTKNLSPMRASDYISIMAIFMFAYIILALILAALIPGSINKIVMAIFGLSPFIIGKLVTYKKVKIYTYGQIFCVILSLVYIIIV